MKSYRILFFSVLMLFATQFSMGQEDKLTKEEMQKDLSYMADYVLKLHPSIGVNIPIASYESWVAEIMDQLPEQADKIQFLSFIEPLIDSLKCGHTAFLLDDMKSLSSLSGSVSGYLPLRVLEIENKILVSQNLSDDSLNIQEGFELLTINGTEVSEVLDQIGRLHIGSDGNNQTGEAYYSAFLLPYGYKMFFGEPDSFRLELKDLQSDSLYEAHFEAPSLASIRGHYQARYASDAPKETIELDILEDDNIALLSVHGFSGYDPFQIFYKIRLKESFTSISNKEIDKLIIDLRGNRGGSIRNCQKFLGYLLQEKRSFFQEASINPAYETLDIEPAYKLKFTLNGIQKYPDRLVLKSWGRKQIKPHPKYNFDGEVVLMTDAGSFSAAAIFSSIIKSTQRARIVGAESGGSYFQTFAGFSKKITLPNSHINLSIPMVRFVHEVDMLMQALDRGVIPDVEIPSTLEDYFQHKDTQLERAKELLKGL